MVMGIKTRIKKVHVRLACVTPNCIPGLWKKYALRQVTLEQVKEGVLTDSKDNGGDDGDGDKNQD